MWGRLNGGCSGVRERGRESSCMGGQWGSNGATPVIALIWWVAVANLPVGENLWTGKLLGLVVIWRIRAYVDKGKEN